MNPQDPPPLRALQCPSCPDPHPGDRQTRPCCLDCRTVWWDWDDLVGPEHLADLQAHLEAERARVEAVKLKLRPSPRRRVAQ